MGVIILTGKSCSGKDVVKGGKMWIRMVDYPKIQYF